MPSRVPQLPDCAATPLSVVISALVRLNDQGGLEGDATLTRHRRDTDATLTRHFHMDLVLAELSRS